MMLMQSATAYPVAFSANLLLRQLSELDRGLLEPHIEEIGVRRGAALFSAGDSIDHLYFPQTNFFSLEEEMSSGRHIEVALVGVEGFLGWAALLGCATSCHAAIAQMRSGSTVRISVKQVRLACASSPTLWQALLRFVHLVIVQMGRTIMSHAEDAIDKRVARWLLMRHDRVGGDALALKHEDVAASLCVRRASVTERLQRLECERLLRCDRGRVLVRDRAALEAYAGSAYGAAEASYRELIAPFGKLHTISAGVDRSIPVKIQVGTEPVGLGADFARPRRYR